MKLSSKYQDSFSVTTTHSGQTTPALISNSEGIFVFFTRKKKKTLNFDESLFMECSEKKIFGKFNLFS